MKHLTRSTARVTQNEITMEENLKYAPQLMVDDSEFDGNAETMMDYIISWTLRRADVECSEEKPRLYNHCRHILGTLLGIEVTDQVIFKSVKVWKQWVRIDLSVELELEIGGKTTKHAILIENKYYSPLHDATAEDRTRKSQLAVYRETFDSHYQKEEQEGRHWEKHYVLITCIKRSDEKFVIYNDAIKYDFTIYHLKELVKKENDKYTDTESDIFNEFWLKWI